MVAGAIVSESHRPELLKTRRTNMENKRNEYVRWSQWDGNGCVNFGQMKLKDVDKNLAEFSKEARKFLEESGADHILYGAKLFDDSGELEEVKFYMTAMTDEQFESEAANKKGVMIYAHHRAK